MTREMMQRFTKQEKLLRGLCWLLQRSKVMLID